MRPESGGSLKKLAVFLLKALIAAALLVFLGVNGRFDFERQVSVLQRPVLIAGLFLLWVLSFLVLVAWRWQRIANVLDLDLPILFAIEAHAVGLFMSSWLPGGMGGDIWKAYSFGKHHSSPEKKYLAYVSVLLDRTLGLYAAVCCGAVAILLNVEYWFTVDYGYLSVLVVVLWSLLSLLGLLVAATPLRLPEVLRVPYRKLERRWRFVGAFPHMVVLARENRRHLGGGLLLSILIQLVNVLFFVVVTQAVTSQRVGFQWIAPVFAIGLIAAVLPIAPGGVGVGHYAFDVLFVGIGLTGGADVFNFFLIVTTLFSLVGVAPFLFSRIRPSGVESGHVAYSADSTRIRATVPDAQ